MKPECFQMSFVFVFWFLHRAISCCGHTQSKLLKLYWKQTLHAATPPASVGLNKLIRFTRRNRIIPVELKTITSLFAISFYLLMRWSERRTAGQHVAYKHTEEKRQKQQSYACEE